MRRVIWVAWLSGSLVLTAAPSILAAQAGEPPAAGTSADSQVLKPRQVLEAGVKLHYKGEYQEADFYLQQANGVRATLTANEQAQLDDMMRRNGEAMKGRNAALELITKTSAALEAGKKKEAEQYLKALQTSRYLNAQDKQVVAALAQQMRGQPLAKPGKAEMAVKQDPDTLMAEARRAVDQKDYDRAEQLAQAARAAGYTWNLPWSDNPDKVMKDVAAGRAKMGQAPTTAENGRASRGMFGGNDQRKQQAVALLQQADQAAKAGDFASARAMLKQAEEMKVNLPVWEKYTVEKVRNEITRAEVAAAKGNQAGGVMQAGMKSEPADAPRAAPQGDARQMVKDARAALAAGDLEAAEQFAKTARNQHTDWGLFEDTADKVLGDVNKAKEAANNARAAQLLSDARRMFEAGQYDEAEKLTWQAEALRKSYPFWYRGERPDRLRVEIVAKKKTTTKPTLPPLVDPATAQQKPATPGSVNMTANVDPRQQHAQSMLAQSRVHLNRGEYKLALDLAVQVKNMNVALPASSDSPDQIIKAVETVMAANDARTNPAQAENTRRQALQHLAEARLAKQQGKLNEAMTCINKARRLNAFYQPADETPEALAAECKQAAMAQMKVFTDAAETLARQNKLKESVEYYGYVQSLALTYNLDAAPATGRMTQLQAQLKAQVAPAAPVVAQSSSPAASSVVPAATPAMPAEQKTAAPVASAPLPTAPTQAPSAPVAQAPSVAPAMTPPTLPAAPPVSAPAQPEVAVAPKVEPKVEENKGQQLLVQAQQALRAGQLEEAKKLAEALYTGPFQMQQQANLLLTQIDEAADRAQSQRCLVAFEQLQRAINRKEFELAQALACEIDVKKLPADKQQLFAQFTAMKEMQAKVVQTQAVVPAQAEPTTPAVAQANPAATPPQGKAGILDEVRARQEVELQRIRELNRQSMLKANQLAGKGDLDGAMEVLQEALTQVQKADLDRGLQAKLEKQLNQRLGDMKTLAEKVAFSKLQKEKLGNGAEKKAQIMMAREHQREEVTRIMKEYATFMNEGKYIEAENAALKARELDPDNTQAEVAIFKARAMRTMTDERRILANKDKARDIQMLDLERSGVPTANDEEPLTINRAVLSRANKRGAVKNALPKNPADKEVHSKLNSMVSVDFKNKPLHYVLDELRTMSGANIVPQDEFLKSENISLDYPIDVKLSDVSLRTALNLILAKARLTYMVRDGVVLVTTQAGKQQDKVTVTYQVNDLIVPRDDLGSLSPAATQIGANGTPRNVSWSKNPVNGDSVSSASMANGAVASTNGSAAANRQVGQTLERQLIQLITETIDPQSWNTLGGSGNITYYPHGMTLVVSQTPDVQEQIEALLARLRELQELQVTVEVRFITITEDFFERVGVDMDLQIRTASNSFNRQVAQGQFGPPGQLNTIGNVNTIVGLTPAGNFTQSLNVPVNNSSFDQSALPAGFAQFPGTPGANGGLDVGLAFLSNIQVFLFMEAVQGDTRSNVLTAPKVTLFNGQTASLSSSVQEFFITSFEAERDLFTGAIVFVPVTSPFTTGIFLTVQAVVTGDRRYVQLSLAPSISRIREVRTFSPVVGLNTQQPVIEFLSVATTVQVPDGGTILMGGLKEFAEQRREFGPPVISKIPYINRLFRNSMYGREASSLLMMVTPRIIIPEEEEERLGETFSF